MLAKKVFKGMAPYKPGKQIEDVKAEYGLEKIIKLASNENPFGFSPKVEQALPELIKSLEIYPDGYSTVLRASLAERLGIDGEQLIFGCGSDEIVEIICRTYLDEGTNTVMAHPTFPQYKHNALIEGAEVREVPLVNGYHDLQGMLNRVDDETKILWLCSPNNPTGSLINKEDFRFVMEKCPDHVLVVVDEAYYEYIETDGAPDSVKALETYANLIVLRTFSKAYGLAGLRIGYGIASKEIAMLLNITRGPFNTTSTAQKAALLALEDDRFLRESIEKNSENKRKFMAFCDQEGLEYYDSQTNFLFVKLPVSGDEMFEHLLSKGFIVRSGEALGHPNGIRVTIGNLEDMIELESHISEYLTSLKEGKIQ
ncbi:histidinol-phosphate transaminase [Sediminibacillus dalangtanensis]|uniref:Histidinol-phosphate aminotransferase n=1 Tax=Sediminibacillus dalangtanensis TaxID=2729421 RepID=A0ABX7VRU7_9BACI|nr:histidinol-phosphate transaminase [Sediminibacillus dalangtanensis]QTM99651.1 histidinol-phosphate transaminase [Sediminibacillus dalangtanensis]